MYGALVTCSSGCLKVGLFIYVYKNTCCILGMGISGMGNQDNCNRYVDRYLDDSHERQLGGVQYHVLV